MTTVLPYRARAVLLLYLALGMSSALWGQEARYALVVGNGDYRFYKPLVQPLNDARDVAESLERRGFEVSLVVNGTKADMENAVKEFGKKIRTPGAVGVFYYSGHRAAADGKVYLPGVEAQLTSPSDLRFESLDLDFVIFRMRSANNARNFLFLDISREVPFPKIPQVPFGFLQDLPGGTFLQFSDEPLVSHPESAGRNTLFSAELLKLLEIPALEFREVTAELKKNITALSGGRQNPWSAGVPVSDFVFNRERKILSLKPAVSQVTDWEKLKMIPLPGGTFIMGAPSSELNRAEGETLHEVTLSPFLMSSTEVPQGLYQRITGKNPSFFQGERLPVDQVTWYDAVAFCNLLSAAEGLRPAYRIRDKVVTLIPQAEGYRLPTEAEWEYAARAGTSTPFSFGLEITTDQANFNGMVPYGNSLRGYSREKTVEPGSFPPNPWGLYDMHGNLWEWCWDFHAPLPSASQKNPTGPASGKFRVSRGGSWRSHGEFLRSAARHFTPPEEGVVNIGFRVVRTGN